MGAFVHIASTSTELRLITSYHCNWLTLNQLKLLSSTCVGCVSPWCIYNIAVIINIMFFNFVGMLCHIYGMPKVTKRWVKCDCLLSRYQLF